VKMNTIDNTPAVGIDLGTTNSAVAIWEDGAPRLLPVDGADTMPSVVGLTPDGVVLVGAAARNQALLHPERTVASVKRRMGSTEPVELGDRQLSPGEVSALILRRLVAAASDALDRPVTDAVITVPAYFNDAQRAATREAGEIAGLNVLRVINEPTAAALCYAGRDERERKLLVFDLGGGTFDVSIVRTRGDLIEVLASHGDTALGGDDFDAAFAEQLRAVFEEKAGVEVGRDPRATIRLLRAAERAKINLSTESYSRVIEEHLAQRDGVGVHLDHEVSRHGFQELIEPWLQHAREAVHVAMRDADVRAPDLDDIVLVGGSSRIPRVAEMLQNLLGCAPRADVDPDKAVALGAAIQAARLAGAAVDHILVDVAPHSLGVSCLGTLDGRPSPHLFQAIIRRNTPLPVSRTEVFYTVIDGQPKTEVEVVQGEDRDARNNRLLGRFTVDGLDRDAPEGSPVHFRFELDLDGILHVEVSERHGTASEAITIADTFERLSGEELAAAREAARADVPDAAAAAIHPDLAWPVGPPPPDLSTTGRAVWMGAKTALDDARKACSELSGADRQEVEELAVELHSALFERDMQVVADRAAELGDVLFYLG